MTAHLPVLIVVLPLAASVIVPLLALVSVKAAFAVALLALAAAALASCTALSHVLAHGVLRYELGGWAPPWGIEYVVDPLSGGVAALITLVAVCVAVYAGPRADGGSAARGGMFHGLYLLLVAGLLGIVLTGDMFNLYVFLEISSLAAYALLASGGIRGTVATFRYLIVGTIAATFYLLGTGYLYALTGTLNMADMAVRLTAVVDARAYGVAVVLIVIGLAIKAALFPLHGWLPDAYTYAPAPVTGFIAAVMAKVSAYALFRVLYFVTPAEGASAQALMLLGWVSVVAVLAGSILAMAQHDIRRMLAYSSVGQMGYIVLGFALGTPAALIGALLHLFGHAVMKGCLFLVVGGIRWRTGIYRISDYAGMGRRMPLTMAAFVVAALAMIGLPPTLGFFSKWYLLSWRRRGGRLAVRGGAGAEQFAGHRVLLSGVFEVRLPEGAGSGAGYAAKAGTTPAHAGADPRSHRRRAGCRVVEPAGCGRHHPPRAAGRPGAVAHWRSLIASREPPAGPIPPSLALPLKGGGNQRAALRYEGVLLPLPWWERAGVRGQAEMMHVPDVCRPDSERPFVRRKASSMSRYPLLAVLVSLLAAGAILLSDRRPNVREAWTFVAAAVKFLLVVSMLPTVLAGGVIEATYAELLPGWSLHLRADLFGLIFALLASGLWILTSIYSIGYMRAGHYTHQTGYFASFAVCLSATMGIAFAGNLITFFLFYEMLTLATYPLVVHDRTEEAVAAGRKYLAYTLGAGATYCCWPLSPSRSWRRASRSSPAASSWARRRWACWGWCSFWG